MFSKRDYIRVVRFLVAGIAFAAVGLLVAFLLH
jgi:hypothetical protein